MSGPARTPTQILSQRGSWRGQRRQNTEPVDAVAAPAAPAFLSTVAREHWAYIVPVLLGRQTIFEACVGPLTLMCLEWAECVEAYEALAKLKRSRKAYKGHLIDHPRVRIKGAFDRYTKMAIQFGLT